MSTETLTQQLVANQPASFGAGTQFLIVTATAALTVVALQQGNSNSRRVFTGVLPGFRFKAPAGDGFDTLQITSATGQTITIAVGDDDVSYSSGVTIENTPSIVELPAVGLTDTAPVSVASGATTNIVPANTTRRRVTLTPDPAAGGTVYARVKGGANDLVPLAPGQSYEFKGTYGLDVRNPTAAAVNVYVAEET